MIHLSLLLLAANPLGELNEILLDIARTLVVGVGGGSGLYFIVNGKAEENPKKTYGGFIAIVAAGLIFSATFAIQDIFS